MLYNSYVNLSFFYAMIRKVTTLPHVFLKQKGLVGTGGRVSNSVDPAAVHGSQKWNSSRNQF
jgi:hypothetical protein